MRRLTCPFDKIVEMIPGAGFHIDVGCGHGVLLALLGRDRPGGKLLGIDLDSRKIAQASRADLPGVEFICGELAEQAVRNADSLSMVDVLYLLPDGGKRELLSACAEALRPGGKLVIKALVTTPSWKHRVILLEEAIMVRFLRITSGEGVFISPVERLARLVESCGFEPPKVFRLDRGYPWPHVCLVSSKR